MNTPGRDNFKPIENPYIVGNPVKEPGMFFGREEDFAFIRQKISGAGKGGLLVLCGARRSGKTSVLFQIMNGRLGADCFPVLIDMQSMTAAGDREFLVKLAGRIADGVGAPDLSPEREFFDRTPDNPLDAFQEFVLEIIRRLAGRRLILLFDEYEIFETLIDNGSISNSILDIFGSWLDHQENIFIVFTGSEKIEHRRREYWGRFLPKAVYSKRISFLAKRDTIRLVDKPLENVVRYEPGVPEEIYDLTAGQPFYTQVLCQAIVDRLNERARYDATAADLEAVVNQIVDNPLPQMIFSWNSLTDADRLILAITAELESESKAGVRSGDIRRFARTKRIGLRIDNAILNESLEKLFHHDILHKDAAGKAYSFKMGLWNRWIARMHSVWEITEEMKDGEGGLGEGISLSTARRKRGGVAAVISVVIVALAVAGFMYLKGRGAPETEMGAPPGPDSRRITIRTDPPGAEVILGGRILGESPIEDRLVPVERASLAVRLPGYKDFEATLDPGDSTQRYQKIVLVRKTGSLRLITSPPGAEAFLNGHPQAAKTPVLIENLPIDELYDVRLTLTGYQPGEFNNVRIFEDSVVSKSHRFEVLEFRVRITSTPDAADVYVDDRFSGKTPNTTSMAYGMHRIEIKKKGYETTALDRRIPQDGREFNAVLRKLPPGVLVIMVRPWADIYIDGELADREKSNFRKTLEPGTYTIRLLNPHYQPKEFEIEVKPDAESVFEWDLQEKENR